MGSHKPPSFRYTKPALSAIRKALLKAGLQPGEQWEQYRDRIIALAYTAYIKKSREPLPYASQARDSLRPLVHALDETLHAYQELIPELQVRLDSQVSDFLEAPDRQAMLEGESFHLLTAILLPSERQVVEKLLTSGRFPLALQMVRAASVSTASQISRGADESFRRTGRRKNDVMRWIVKALGCLYIEATGKKPIVFSNAYNDGYDGEFYSFAAAAIRPLGIVPETSLGSSILTATNEFRKWLKRK